MGLLFYRLLNYAVGLIPRKVLRYFLRALYVRPDVMDRAGYQLYPQVFSNPFPIPAEVDAVKLEAKRSLPAIDTDPAPALALLKTLAQYSAEADQFLKSRVGNILFWDRTFGACDSATLYAMLRQLKPRRYLEVGCGYSSRASVAALKANAEEGHACECLFIEPYPPAHLKEMKLPGELLAKKIEQVPLERFQELEAGDVLFIDTSHVIKVQNDVEYELIHILPSLKAGVFVHIHDIFTPYDYPAEWLIGTGTNRGGNNEQYALECLLSGGADWEIILPVHLLWREHRAALAALVNSDQRPASFWIRKLAAPRRIGEK
jgi:hypothetical protein